MERFPNNKHQEENQIEKKQYDFSNGCILKANKDLPFFGIDKGDSIRLNLENGYLKVGPLSWDVEQLTKEIDEGIWTIEENL